jgi:hypothetical protein
VGFPGNRYHLSVSKKLSASNPYLRDPVVRKESLWVSAKSSSAIEGIHHPFSKDALRTVSRSGATRHNVAKSGEPRRGK